MPTQTALTKSSKTNKRKADASDAQSSSKKARTTAQATVQLLVKSILASPDTFPLPSSEDATRGAFVDLAQRIEMLESGAKGGRGSALVKTPEELKASAEIIRNTACSGITKLMTWKPTCKTGRAKWAYDGVCSDPDVFAVLMGLDARPTWKMKKISLDDFEKLIGEIEGEVRYATLSIKSKEITVRWTESTGEFKFSGLYGK